jgi:hypothetical protein
MLWNREKSLAPDGNRNPVVQRAAQFELSRLVETTKYKGRNEMERE